MRGATDNIKRRAIFDYHRSNADLLVLLETHSQPNSERIWEHEWGGKAIYSHGSSAARGVAMFISKQLYSCVRNIYTDMEGRMILIDIHQNDQMITVMALYAPNVNSETFFVEVGKQLKERFEHKVLIGDFNCTLTLDLDRQNTYCNNNRAKEEIENLMEQYYLKDVWRIQNQDKREYSWFKKGEITKASRIDYALVSAGLDQKIETVMYISSLKTDHRAVYMVVNLHQSERGKGFWKFNTMLLKNQEYLSMMNQYLDEYTQRNLTQNPAQDWEILKKKVKEKNTGILKKQCEYRQASYCSII